MRGRKVSQAEAGYDVDALKARMGCPAHKHDISSDDVIEAATWPLVTLPLDDEYPCRILGLGFDAHSRLL